MVRLPCLHPVSADLILIAGFYIIFFHVTPEEKNLFLHTWCNDTLSSSSTLTQKQCRIEQILFHLLNIGFLPLVQYDVNDCLLSDIFCK